MSKQAIIYARTANKEQVGENFLLIRQVEMCLALVKESRRFDGAMVVTDKEIKGGGKKQNRLVGLFGYIKREKAEALIVYDTYRLSRDREEFKGFKESLETAGVELITVIPDIHEVDELMIKIYKKELGNRIRRTIKQTKYNNENEKHQSIKTS